MRFAVALALLALLAGCAGGPDKAPSDKPVGDGDTALQSYARLAGEQFDYRYAFRMPGNRIKAVQDSHAEGCVRLGPARCRILDQRYQVIDGKPVATLTYQIDPAIARQFGDNATKVVNSANGALLESHIAGFDMTSAARENALIARIRKQLANAQAQRAATPANTPQRQLIDDRIARIQVTLGTIADIEADDGNTLATTPVLISYTSSGSTVALGNGATLEDAWQSLQSSFATAADFFAKLLPFFLVLIVGVLGLRWLVQGGLLNSTEEKEPNRLPVPAPIDEDDEDRPNIIRRWFNRDDQDHETQHS